MSKNLLEAAEKIVEELTPDERRRLAAELTQQTRNERWDRLFAAIDARVKRYGAPSEAEIVRLCREVRRERSNARRRA